jgi:hypothetical protein
MFQERMPFNLYLLSSGKLAMLTGHAQALKYWSVTDIVRPIREIVQTELKVIGIIIYICPSQTHCHETALL